MAEAGAAGAAAADSAELRRRFEADGYVVIRALWSRDEVDAMGAAFDALERLAAAHGGGDHHGARFVVGDRADGTGRGDAIQRVVWCGGAVDVLLGLGGHPRLLGVVRALLGADALVQIINQAHFKRPGESVTFPWHQDCAHRRIGTPEWTDVNGRGSFVESVTAVDPMSTDNGPLEVVVGSHHRGALPYVAADRRLAPGLVDTGDAVQVLLEPGDTVFFGPYLIHGSGANRSDRPRRAFLNGYALPGANRRHYPGCGTGRTM